ncbi:MAG: HD domain-containing phosphohydrolase [Candidatus Eisenbacteria bacterium]
MKPNGSHDRAYAWVVFALGMGLLAWLSARGPEGSVAFPANTDLVLWTAMILVAALSPVPLPRGLGSATLTPALDVAAFLLFGPAVACWVGALSRLFAGMAQRWNPFLTGIQRVGTSVLAIGGAGSVFVALGGRTGAELALRADQAGPLAVACATYLLVKTLLGAGAARLGAGARSRGLRAFLREATPGDLVVVPFGVLLALTQVRIGPVGAALFLLPLLFARYVFKLWVETRNAHLGMVRTLMSAVDAGDAFTRGHSYRISKMSLRVGRHLGLPEADLDELEFAALLHDIGRTAIQRDILIKTGRLTEQEQLVLRMHPRIGHDIMAGLKFFPRAAKIVLAHHEQPDGQGYPQGLARADIPVASRIIMAVAAFDAMTSDRPYRRGLSPEEAFEELLAHAGRQFFPDVVEAIAHLYADGSLFAEFEEDHLARYREGQEHSRAVEGHLRRHAPSPGVPVKTGREQRGGARPAVDLPILELPALALPGSVASEAIAETIALPGRASLVVAGRTDLGCKRSNNEDAFGVFEYESARGTLLVLADGMGGAAAGEVASRLAVDTLSAAYGEGKRAKSAGEELRRGIEAANRVIHAQAAADARQQGMGTTCTAASIVGLDLTIGHVGDSRAYLVRAGGIEQLTLDHTLAAELERVAGDRLPAPEGASHLLTRSLGSLAEVTVDISAAPIRLEPGAVLVLCSDGLSNMVEDAELAEIVTGEPPAEACETLIELARERGGPDNITLLVARVQGA